MPLARRTLLAALALVGSLAANAKQAAAGDGKNPRPQAGPDWLSVGVSFSTSGRVVSSGCTWTLVDYVLDEPVGLDHRTIVDATGGGTGTRHLWQADCPNGETRWVLLPVATPRDLLPRLVDALTTEYLPRPDVLIQPMDEQFGWVYVKVPLDFRTTAASWRTITLTASAGDLWATATANPAELTFESGDPHPDVSATATCTGDAPLAGYEPRLPGACSYTYGHASSTSPQDGYHFATRLVTRWTAAWQTSDGASGTFPDLHTESTRPLAVAEIEGIVCAPGTPGC